jgi:hypothetical protein
MKNKIFITIDGDGTVFLDASKDLEDIEVIMIEHNNSMRQLSDNDVNLSNGIRARIRKLRTDVIEQPIDIKRFEKIAQIVDEKEEIEEMRDYIEYVRRILAEKEMPRTFEQWK